MKPSVEGEGGNGWLRSKYETVEELLRRADAVAPGARDVVARLRAAGKRMAYVTNNSRHSAAEIAAKLRGLGLAAEAEDVVAATEGVGRYARERYGALRVKAAAGHEVVGIDDEACPEAVVVGLDRASRMRSWLGWSATLSGERSLSPLTPTGPIPGRAGRACLRPARLSRRSKRPSVRARNSRASRNPICFGTRLS
ncbi:HAD family hydrolase [Paenibacillus sp. GCM10027626]|uniref:HAD family hydrolase n=1 Tax=Paenibacillus sp. GCM10027626 TaxID=3273411 RepID=UPI0036321519